MIRRWLREIKLGVQIVANLGDVKFCGRCDCGCDDWLIDFRGRRVTVSERNYDKLRYLRAVRT